MKGIKTTLTKEVKGKVTYKQDYDDHQDAFAARHHLTDAAGLPPEYWGDFKKRIHDGLASGRRNLTVVTKNGLGVEQHRVIMEFHNGIEAPAKTPAQWEAYTAA